MSMIVCEWCDRYIDSNDDPDCFVLVSVNGTNQKCDMVICEACRDEQDKDDVA